LEEEKEKEKELKEFTDKLQKARVTNGFGPYEGLKLTGTPLDLTAKHLAKKFGVINDDGDVIEKVITKHLTGFCLAGELPAAHVVRWEMTGELTDKAENLLVNLLGIGLVNQYQIGLKKQLVEEAMRAKVPWYKRIFKRKTKP
jgi:hypothetical protein